MPARKPFQLEGPPLETEQEPKTLQDWIDEAPIGVKPQKAAKPTITFNLRLNEHERSLLEAVALASGRSMQREAKRQLLMGLERSRREIKKSQSGARSEPPRS